MRSLLYALTVLSLPMRGAWIEITGLYWLTSVNRSLPMRGAWIEIQYAKPQHNYAQRRSPCGERGLKSAKYALNLRQDCRSPCGERGLKWKLRKIWLVLASRSPCGERGLKFILLRAVEQVFSSLPMRGAWIEIYFNHKMSMIQPGRSPCGERGLK